MGNYQGNLSVFSLIFITHIHSSKRVTPLTLGSWIIGATQIVKREDIDAELIHQWMTTTSYRTIRPTGASKFHKLQKGDTIYRSQQ
jgi:hypothetical protein